MVDRDSDEGSPSSPYDDDGIDRSVIRWMLSLTPDERLRFLDETLALVAATRRVEHGPP